MTRRQHPPLDPGRVYGEFINANGTTFVLRASPSGQRMNVCLHHDEGPQVAAIRNPTEPAERFIRWQGRLWSSNPDSWKQEVKRLAFETLDTALVAPEDSGVQL